MKNVAIVVFNITKKAGTERAATNLANMLSESDKYMVNLYSCFSNEEQKPSYQLNQNISVTHLGCKEYRNKVKNYITLVKKLREAVACDKINLVVGTSSVMNILITFINSKISAIGCEHMNFTYLSPLKRFLRNTFYKRLDKVVLLTQRAQSHYQSLLQKTTVIPNSLSFIPKESAKLQNKRIIAVGRLTYQKGFDMLLDAAVEIKKSAPDWCIDIIGDGEDKSQLLEKIEKLKLKKYVNILPPTPHIQEELLNSSIYLMSSRFEGLPMVLIEAKSIGLPSVSFTCPEGPDEIIVDGVDGYWVEPFDVKLLAEAVIDLIQDDEKRKMFGQKAFQNAERFSPSYIFTLWDELLTTLPTSPQC